MSTARLIVDEQKLSHWVNDTRCKLLCCAERPASDRGDCAGAFEEVTDWFRGLYDSCGIHPALLIVSWQSEAESLPSDSNAGEYICALRILTVPVNSAGETAGSGAYDDALLRFLTLGVGGDRAATAALRSSEGIVGSVLTRDEGQNEIGSLSCEWRGIDVLSDNSSACREGEATIRRIQLKVSPDAPFRNGLAEIYRLFFGSCRVCFGAGAHAVGCVGALGLGGKLPFDGHFRGAESAYSLFEQCDIFTRIALQRVLATILDVGAILTEIMLTGMDVFFRSFERDHLIIPQARHAIAKIASESCQGPAGAFSALERIRNTPADDRGSASNTPRFSDLTYFHLLREIGRSATDNTQFDSLASAVTDSHHASIGDVTSPRRVLALAQPLPYFGKKEPLRLSEDKVEALFNLLLTPVSANGLSAIAELIPSMQESAAKLLIDKLRVAMEVYCEWDLLNAIWQSAVLLARRGLEDRACIENLVGVFEECRKKYLASEGPIERVERELRMFRMTLAHAWGLWPVKIRWKFVDRFKGHLDEFWHEINGNSRRRSDDMFSSDTQINEDTQPRIGLILVASQKGGVGKSSIAATLCAAALQQGENILLVEADVAGSTFGFSAGAGHIFDLYDLAEAHTKKRRIAEVLKEWAGNGGLWKPIDDENLTVIPSPKFHCRQRRLSSFTSDYFLRKCFTDLLSELIEWARKEGFKRIVIDLPPEFRDETMSAFSVIGRETKSLVLLVSRPSLCTLLPMFEWANVFGVGENIKLALVVNSVPPSLRCLWNKPEAIADLIMTDGKGDIVITKAQSSAFVQSLMPWERVFSIPDIPALREQSGFDRYLRAREHRDLLSLAGFVRDYFQQPERDE